MIDIQLLRKNPEEVAKRLATRGPGAFDLAHFERLEGARKELQTAVEQAQASRNRIAKDIGQAKAKGQDVGPLLEQAEKLKALLEKSEQQLALLRRNIDAMAGGLQELDALLEGRTQGRRCWSSLRGRDE